MTFAEYAAMIEDTYTEQCYIISDYKVSLNGVELTGATRTLTPQNKGYYVVDISFTQIDKEE